MRISVLGSGSSGNAVLVCSGGTALLIDAGLNFRETGERLSRLEAPPARIDAVLITHEHHDHVASVSPVARGFGATVWITRPTLGAAAKRFPGGERVEIFGSGETFGIGDLRIESIKKRHDAADPVGFLVHEGEQTFGCFTDLGSVDDVVGAAMARCSALFIESNHDPVMLQRGPYPAKLRARIASDVGHLSNADAARAVARWASPRLRHLVVGHVSETNNTPDLVKAAFLEHLGPPGDRVLRRVSYQGRPTPFVDLAATAPAPSSPPASAAGAA